MEKLSYYENREQKQGEVMKFWKSIAGSKIVLDLGCGTGFMGKYKPADCELYGVDNDDIALREAKRYEFVKKVDLETYKLPFKGGHFDAVIAKDILEHLLRPWLMVGELNRILRPGGIIAASVPSPCTGCWDDYTHVRPFTPQSLNWLFRDNGFKIIKIEPEGGLPLFGILGLGWALPWLLKLPLLRRRTTGYFIVAKKENHG